MKKRHKKMARCAMRCWWDMNPASLRYRNVGYLKLKSRMEHVHLISRWVATFKSLP